MTRLLRAWRVSFSVGLLLHAPVLLAQDTLTIPFTPPQGTRVLERCMIEKAVGDTAITERTRSEGSTRYEIRARDGGYSIVATGGIRPDIPFEGSEYADLLEGIETFAITYDVDQYGNLQAVRGGDELVERILGVFPDEMRAAMEASLGQALSSEALGQYWTQRQVFGLLSGQTVILDTLVSRDMDYPSPTGQMNRFRLSLEVSRTSDCATRDCIVLSLTQETDGPEVIQQMFGALKGMIVDMARRMGEEEAAANLPALPEVRSGDLRQTYKRHIDLATGLPQSSLEVLHIKGTMDYEGETTDILARNTQDCTYSLE